MCAVIVVDAGRSRSTNLGRDAYVMMDQGLRGDGTGEDLDGD